MTTSDAMSATPSRDHEPTLLFGRNVSTREPPNAPVAKNATTAKAMAGIRSRRMPISFKGKTPSLHQTSQAEPERSPLPHEV